MVGPRPLANSLLGYSNFNLVYPEIESFILIFRIIIFSKVDLFPCGSHGQILSFIPRILTLLLGPPNIVVISSQQKYYLCCIHFHCNNLENGNWFTKISKINYNKNDPALIFITKFLLKRFQTESYTYTLK